MRRRKLAGPQPVSKLPGELTDPYQREPEQTPEKIFATLITPEQDMRPARFPQTRDGRQSLPPAAQETQERSLAEETAAMAEAVAGSRFDAA